MPPPSAPNESGHPPFQQGAVAQRIWHPCPGLPYLHLGRFGVVGALLETRHRWPSPSRGGSPTRWKWVGAGRRGS
eukprot:390694-Pyramimonas_sp.AAC.1